MNKQVKKYSFEAVIFDLDGVVTKTAVVHARAWKAAFDEYLRLREKRGGEPFREFTYQEDYLTYVDGKPRYEGVKSFLESRSINLSFGEPSDSPDTETVCGIGNKKNIKFEEVLKAEGVEVYPSTIKLIKELKNSGVRIGVASSSKNCKYILHSANIEDLFETRVDGEVSARIGLKGKPEGDIFVTAASNLGAMPKESIVVEDAISGVEAGRNGGFGLVIGLARENNESELLENGADVAVTDLSGISLAWVDQWFHRTPRPLFEAWDIGAGGSNLSSGDEKNNEKPAINPYYLRSAKEALFRRKKLVFFLDYDGTLTPIVDRPEQAVISEEMKNVIKDLSRKYVTAIVSGRMREDVENLVGIEGLCYAGSHGFDISGPDLSMVQPEAKEAVSLISQAAKRLSEELRSIAGILIEDKKFSAAVHYRLVNEGDLPRIENLVNSIVQGNPSLRLMKGKKVFEILPAIDWNKGKAIRWIMQALGISWPDVSVIYIGDDTTDEDGFRVVRTRGTGILVASGGRCSAAGFLLSSPQEVRKLFEKIIKFS